MCAIFILHFNNNIKGERSFFLVLFSRLFLSLSNSSNLQYPFSNLLLTVQAVGVVGIYSITDWSCDFMRLEVLGFEKKPVLVEAKYVQSYCMYDRKRYGCKLMTLV